MFSRPVVFVDIVIHVVVIAVDIVVNINVFYAVDLSFVSKIF